MQRDPKWDHHRRHIGAVPSGSKLVQRCLTMWTRSIRPWLRVTWALTSVGLMAIMVFALSATPPLLFIRALWNSPYSHDEARMLVVAIAMLPA
jgi:hypothetical protein